MHVHMYVCALHLYFKDITNMQGDIKFSNIYIVVQDKVEIVTWNFYVNSTPIKKLICISNESI